MIYVVERCPSCGLEHDVSEAGACEACHEPLRYWCRRHGRDAGWLAGPDCPRCAEEAARPAPPPRPAPSVATERTVPRGLGAPSALMDVPAERPVLRGLGPPPADVEAPVPVAARETRRALRDDRLGALVGPLMMLLLGAAGGGLDGMVAGMVYGSVALQGSSAETPLQWGMLGACAGFIIALIIDALAFFAPRPPPRG